MEPYSDFQDVINFVHIVLKSSINQQVINALDFMINISKLMKLQLQLQLQQ